MGDLKLHKTTKYLARLIGVGARLRIKMRHIMLKISAVVQITDYFAITAEYQSYHFSVQLCQPGCVCLNKDPTVWLDGARSPQNTFAGK